MEVWISYSTWSRASDESNLNSMCNKSEPHIEKLLTPYGGGMNRTWRKCEPHTEEGRAKVNGVWILQEESLNPQIRKKFGPEQMMEELWTSCWRHANLNLTSMITSWRSQPSMVESLMEKVWIAWRKSEQHEEKVWTAWRLSEHHVEKFEPCEATRRF
jgi:hypothetical protein